MASPHEIRAADVPPVTLLEPHECRFALPRRHVATLRELVPHERCPGLHGLLDRPGEPYEVAGARGVLVGPVPIVEVWGAVIEADGWWSGLSQQGRFETWDWRSVRGLLVAASRFPAFARPLPEDTFNPRKVAAPRQAGARQARWRGQAEHQAVLWAVADRFGAAVASSFPEMRWSRQMAWRLSGMEPTKRPMYLRWVPPGAMLFAPVSPWALPTPGADPVEGARALWSSTSNVELVRTLSAHGWLVACEAEAWLLGFTVRCLTGLDDDLDRVQELRREVAGVWYGG